MVPPRRWRLGRTFVASISVARRRLIQRRALVSIFEYGLPVKVMVSAVAALAEPEGRVTVGGRIQRTGTRSCLSNCSRWAAPRQWVLVLRATLVRIFAASPTSRVWRWSSARNHGA